MQVTILFGGTNKERLVSVASTQALHRALPDADLWFWDVDDTVHAVTSEKLLGHTRPFEVDFKPDGRGIALDQALDKASAEQRVLVFGLHALRAHRALSCAGYSRSDFIVSANGPVYLETNTLPGLTAASLYPKALKAQGIAFADFLNDQIELARRRVRR